jgi:hypothetical protein
MPFDLKTGLDATAITTAVASFFTLIPWSSVAAFLSAIYLLCRVYYIIKNKGK